LYGFVTEAADRLDKVADACCAVAREVSQIVNCRLWAIDSIAAYRRKRRVETGFAEYLVAQVVSTTFGREEKRIRPLGDVRLHVLLNDRPDAFYVPLRWHSPEFGSYRLCGEPMDAANSSPARGAGNFPGQRTLSTQAVHRRATCVQSPNSNEARFASPFVAD
jgi:hypothetical protein